MASTCWKYAEKSGKKWEEMGEKETIKAKWHSNEEKEPVAIVYNYFLVKWYEIST